MERTQTKKQVSPTPKKKVQPGAPVKKRTSPAQFFREVRAELKKVAWPARNELVQSTVMVLVILTIVTITIYAMDMAFSQTTTLLTR